MPTRVMRAQAFRRAVATVALVSCLSCPNLTTAVHGQTSARQSFSAPDVRIGVLGLFHPREFRVQSIASQSLVLHAGSESVALEPSSAVGAATIHLSDDGLTVTTRERVFHASRVSVGSRDGEPADFILTIPGKISRRYHGTLEIRPSSASLLAILTVDRETAVASVVAAESDPDTPLEALKAQAIATRSYFVAGRGRHHDFDFCDTTHCQFFRNPPAHGSHPDIAVEATRDLVLAYDDQPFPAMYTRSCSGRTHTPSELGVRPTAYPYYSVACEYCRSHPANWTTRLSTHDAASLHSSDELARLKIDRQFGWSTVPSNDFVVTREGDQVLLRGVGNGHGIGLCQSGARAMAKAGATFQEILDHYYPNTAIVSWRPVIAATPGGSTPLP